MHLVIGCPIRDRAWIIPDWFDHVRTAIDMLTIEHEIRPVVEFAFIGDPEGDPTFPAIDLACTRLGFSRTVIEVDEDYEPYKRAWNMKRYQHMADLRNRLLWHVRSIEPDLFWSLDSDVLVAPRALATLVETLRYEREFDAAGGKIYMTSKGTGHSSYGMLLGQGGLLRPEADGLFAVDVIMATKLMTSKAYAVDYSAHRQGEDIGWSLSARKAGCKLIWDGRVCSKHVMEPAELYKVDERVGF
jgi:hypothetical protein